IAVASSAAALLATELLAGAGHVAALTRGAGRATAIDQLPGDDAVQNIRARLDTEDLVVEIDVAARRLGVEGLNLDLHRLAFLALVGGRASFTLVGRTGISVFSSLFGRRCFGGGCFSGRA